MHLVATQEMKVQEAAGESPYIIKLVTSHLKIPMPLVEAVTGILEKQELSIWPSR